MEYRELINLMDKNCGCSCHNKKKRMILVSSTQMEILDSNSDNPERGHCFYGVPIEVGDVKEPIVIYD